MPRAVFDIFLSSTSKDLKPYRDKVAEMVERMRQTTIRMERFGAKPSKPLATCKEEVLACDALIVILGHRYGWVPSVAEGGDGERSITWWEVGVGARRRQAGLCVRCRPRRGMGAGPRAGSAARRHHRRASGGDRPRRAPAARVP